jgi:hypothetical protein
LLNVNRNRRIRKRLSDLLFNPRSGAFPLSIIAFLKIFDPSAKEL